MKNATIAKIVRQFIEKECPLFCGYRLSEKTEKKTRDYSLLKITP